ncbi:hypothetical protein [Paenibacillus sp. XY044]|uniref:hypothetical protein n=1 Tax=Paenibacillus sp. XY044 TaxID=2026089 RepID=UPI000B985753|nr:hypothetical protein [Paenibacillus sp. XY044]OZB98060.1 hypothetical protein CJP46_02520 [Paenibacillus sp. XY044]
MITTESIFSKLSDDDLRKAFAEYENWRETGVLQEGIIRRAHEELQEVNGYSIMIHSLTEPLLYVIIKRLIK